MIGVKIVALGCVSEGWAMGAHWGVELTPLALGALQLLNIS